MNQENSFHILALDGGGARGIYAAQVLAEIERAYGVKVKDCFDLLAGTSTGAIIAGGAAAGIPMDKIVNLFEDEAPRIFRKARSRVGLLRSKYSRKPLDEALQKHLPNITLGEINSALMITSSDISTGGVYVFKSRYFADMGKPYVRDGHTKLKDAIGASCSAPSYFDPAKVGPNLLADGGLWANNPSIIALTEAVSTFGKNMDEIKILSIGTGHALNLYRSKRYWGLLTGWGGEKLVSYFLNLQSQASTNMSGLILKDNYLRLDPSIENWGLDDTKHLPNLKALAKQNFAQYTGKIQAHLKGAAK